MLRIINVKLNAEHPELPLIEAATFVGSPSAVFIRGIPPAVGSWRITSVKVVATYPDNSAPTVECVRSADGVYVATIPATATSGRVANGLQITADGIDERGEAVTGYVLGIADLAVYLRDMTIEGAAGVKYYLHLLDAEPDNPKEGDAYLDGTTLNIYHDGEWTEIAGGGYEPPPGGIPKTDLSAGVQASLDKADSALQTAPVTSVNGKTGAVLLSASDVEAVPISGGIMSGVLTTTGIIISTGGERVGIGVLLETLIFTNLTHGKRLLVPFPKGVDFDYIALRSEIPSVTGLAPLASPAFTGTPTAPNIDAQSTDGQVANKKYVDDSVAGATPNLDYVMRVDPETGGIYYTTPDTNA